MKRDFYLQQLLERLGNGLIKVITGIRRCGKSYLVFTLSRIISWGNEVCRQNGLSRWRWTMIPTAG